MKRNYYLNRDSKTGEMLYFEFDKLDGYNIMPKNKVMDAISVEKIVFVNPGLSEKIMKKKIDIKIRALLKQLKTFDEDGDDEDGIRYSLMEAERLKLNILNTYCKYLGNTYGSLSIKKVQIIINQLRIKLYKCMNRDRFNGFSDDLYYLEQDEYRGRSR